MSPTTTKPGLRVMTPREASIFACLTDAMLCPEPDLPPVALTRAVADFDLWLERSPALNRFGLRAGLYLAELAPLAAGRGARLRRLDRPQRADFVAQAERGSGFVLRSLMTALRVFAGFNYYGDDAVSRQLGYDADTIVKRGRALRSAEGRP